MRDLFMRASTSTSSLSFGFADAVYVHTLHRMRGEAWT